MQKIIFTLATVIISTCTITAQHQYSTVIRNAATGEALPGATAQILNSNLGGSADQDGRVEIRNIPAGQHTLVVSSVGFSEKRLDLTFPAAKRLPAEILLEPLEEELEAVIVTSTRISRNIEDISTRIETISLEEIDEKSNMRPSNISMLLHESTGIQVQQTSYTSATQTIRIQGLDGKYTQLLKDGFPNYGGFSSGLSLLDIPPLDLRQVEIIKGSASTFYGGGAIAGVVNLISKTPSDKREINLILNQTSALGTDLGTFLSGRNKKTGFTFLGTAHFQKEFDVDDDDFTEIPRQKEFTFFPKLFLYPSEDLTIVLGNSFTMSDRLGGDVQVIRDNPDVTHRYFEENNSYRNNTYFTLEKGFSEKEKLVIKQSVNVFDRQLNKPDYYFAGQQTIAYSDISYTTEKRDHTLVFGVNYLFDEFREKQDSSLIKRNQKLSTVSLYLQDNWDVSEKVLMEGGLRLDHNFTYKTFVLPRISLLYKISKAISTRLGGGLGYKMPTIFAEESESIFFQDLMPLTNAAESERSIGASLDFNFSKDLSENVYFSFNQLFFNTQIDHPLVLDTDPDGNYFFMNAPKAVQSSGFETNARLIISPFKFFVGYTFVNARAKYKSGNQFVAITPKNKLNLVLLLEKHHNYKFGLESYWTDRQYLLTGERTPSFWEFGFFAEKTLGAFSVFINFENFTDTRQNRFETVVIPPHEDPGFRQVYTHTEGFVINGGIKLKL